jgi:hypothetical protein
MFISYVLANSYLEFPHSERRNVNGGLVVLQRDGYCLSKTCDLINSYPDTRRIIKP